MRNDERVALAIAAVVVVGELAVPSLAIRWEHMAWGTFVLMFGGGLVFPIVVAGGCWWLWAKAKARWLRITGGTLFWILIVWLLGWFLKWFYVTHIWYSWASEGKF